MTLEDLRLDDLYYERRLQTPTRDVKAVPGNIDRQVCVETRLNACCMKDAA